MPLVIYLGIGVLVSMLFILRGTSINNSIILGVCWPLIILVGLLISVSYVLRVIVEEIADFFE